MATVSFALVADAATFKRKATRIDDRGRVLLVADIPMHPISGHRWSDNLVPLDQIGARLAAGGLALTAALEPEAVSDEDRVIGFWGEQEVCRRLAMLEDCALLRPFPDTETAEILIRRLESGATLGIQVKTGQLSEPHARQRILVNRSNFEGAPTTLLVALGWLVGERRFHETCLAMPTDVLPSLSAAVGPNYELNFRPSGSRESSRLDPYRVPLKSLAEEFGKRLFGLS